MLDGCYLWTQTITLHLKHPGSFFHYNLVFQMSCKIYYHRKTIFTKTKSSVQVRNVFCFQQFKRAFVLGL